MIREIEVFNNILEIDKPWMLDIKLHIKIQKLAKEAGDAVCNIFNDEKDIDKLLEIIVPRCVLIYRVEKTKCEEYLNKYGINSIELEDLFQKDLYISNEYKEFKDAYLKAVINGEKALRQFKKSLNNYLIQFQQAVYMDVYDWLPNIESLLKYQGIPIRAITVADEEEGEILFNCLKDTSNNVDQMYEFAFRLFQTDPTELEYYEYCMVRFPEQLANLIRLQKLVGFEIKKEILNKSLKNLLKSYPHDTEKQTIILKNKLLDIQEEVDISKSAVLKKVDKLLYDFDVQARTFNNIVFDTRKLKEKAEKDFNVLSEFCGEIEVMDEEECRSKKKWISEQNFAVEVAQIFLDKLDNKIDQIWATEDSSKIQAIFYRTNILEQKSIARSVEKITRMGRTKDKNRYINALNAVNEENLALVQEYEKWENISFLKKYGISIVLLIGAAILDFSGVGFVLLLFGSVLLIRQMLKANRIKKIWNLMTLDGEVIHPQIMMIKNDDNMRCEHCGRMISRKAKFCNFCGSKIISKG